MNFEVTVKITGEDFIECLEGNCEDAMMSMLEDIMSENDYGDLTNIEWEKTEHEYLPQYGEWTAFVNVIGYVTLYIAAENKQIAAKKAIATATYKQYGNSLEVKKIEIVDITECEETDVENKPDAVVPVPLANGGGIEDAEIYRHGEDDYSVFFPVSDCSVRGTLKDVIRELTREWKSPEEIAKLFAYAQWTDQDDPLVSFDYEGQDITNPWVDPSGRFEHGYEEAVRIYGDENVTKFVNDVNKLVLE